MSLGPKLIEIDRLLREALPGAIVAETGFVEGERGQHDIGITIIHALHPSDVDRFIQRLKELMTMATKNPPKSPPKSTPKSAPKPPPPAAKKKGGR